jgi:hypothetical protein
MFKKLFLGLLILLVLLVTSLYFTSTIKSKKSERLALLLATAITVSDEYVKGYRGTMDTSTLSKALVSSNVVDTLTSFDTSLKSLNTKSINIDKMFLNYEQETEDGYIKRRGSTEVLIHKDIEDDTRIFYTDGQAFVNIVDLKDDGTGLESIFYKGVELVFELTAENTSLDSISNDPTNIYIYSTHEFLPTGLNNSLKILYTSLMGDSKVLVFTYVLAEDKLSSLTVVSN